MASARLKNFLVPDPVSRSNSLSDSELGAVENTDLGGVPTISPTIRRPRRRQDGPPAPEREAEVEAWWQLYVDGSSAAQVGAAFGVSKQAVLAAFHTRGYVTRGCRRRANPGLLFARITAASWRYEQGIPVAQIARQMRISRNYAYELVRAGGRSPERDRQARRKVG